MRSRRMSWSRERSCGNEAGKILWELPAYTRGRGLDVGCGQFKAYPHFIGVDDYTDTRLFGAKIKPDVASKADRLGLFEDRSLDFVFSSHLLEHLSEPLKALIEWARVIKDGGHLVLYLPDEDQYPKVGEPGANPDHKWDVNYARVVELMDQVERDWDLIRFERRSGGDEYSLFL